MIVNNEYDQEREAWRKREEKGRREEREERGRKES
jgi:hypothetical protein